MFVIKKGITQKMFFNFYFLKMFNNNYFNSNLFFNVFIMFFTRRVILRSIVSNLNSRNLTFLDSNRFVFIV